MHLTVDSPITVGVLALQGGFDEHIQHLKNASKSIPNHSFNFIEVRTAAQLDKCDALIIPGGESTTMSLVAERSELLEPLREYVKVHRKPTWGTCAGMILLSEEANRTKKNGQELIGGLDVRVNRNHFGRQTDSFQDYLTLPFLSNPDSSPSSTSPSPPFWAIFIRAPIIEAVLPNSPRPETVRAPSKVPLNDIAAKFTDAGNVEILARLPVSKAAVAKEGEDEKVGEQESRIVAVKQGNCFGTSFHPELGSDVRVHKWWLEQVIEAVGKKKALEAEAGIAGGN